MSFLRMRQIPRPQRHIKSIIFLWKSIHLLEDLLLSRAPDLDFFAKGPPKTLRKQLAKIARRTEDCRKGTEQIARELGLAALLRQE